MSGMERWLRFVHLEPFEADWKRLGFADEELRELELAILARPDGPPIVAGTGGLRKIRFAPSRLARGKRGAVRVGYVHFARAGLVALIVAYAKNEKGNLTPAEKREIQRLVREIEQSLETGFIR